MYWYYHMLKSGEHVLLDALVAGDVTEYVIRLNPILQMGGALVAWMVGSSLYKCSHARIGLGTCCSLYLDGAEASVRACLSINFHSPSS